MGSAQASDYLENRLIDHLFRSTSLPKFTTVYLGLFTAAPSDAGGGTEVSGTGTGYARVAVPANDASWRATQGGNSGPSIGDSGLTSNATTIVFPAPTGGWGDIRWFGIFDAASGGNLLIWDVLTVTRIVNAGDPAPAFPIDSLTISVN